MPVKPLLFIDVDGVLNLHSAVTKRGFTPPKVRGKDEIYEWERHETFPRGWETKGLSLVMTPRHGEELLNLQKYFTLLWATTWNEEANEWIAPLVGLPSLPVVKLPDEDYKFDWKRKAHHRGSWKTYWLARWLDEYGWYKNETGVATRLPWAFIDDEINRYDYAWLQQWWQEKAKTPVAPRLLLHVESNFGLRTRDFETLETWGKAQQVDF